MPEIAKVERAEASEKTRIMEAYLRMAAQARYRPAAPGDGFGFISLTTEELADQRRLQAEAAQYAERFMQEEDELAFRIGSSNYKTNRVLVLTIEAARVLCGGSGDRLALKLLGMAVDELVLLLETDTSNA